MADQEFYYVECSCTDAGHVLRFTLFPPSKEDPEPSLYVDFQIPRRHLLRRLWDSFTGRIPVWDCTVLDDRGVADLRAILDRYTQWEKENSSPR